MTMKLPTLALLASLLPAATFAQHWIHGAAPMGQFEGQLSQAEGVGFYYGCAGFYSTFSAEFPGKHEGMANLVIDGQNIARLKMSPSFNKQGTGFELKMNRDSSRAEIVAYNQILMAIASGNELVIQSDDGQALHRYPLAGSADIKSCKMNVPA